MRDKEQHRHDSDSVRCLACRHVYDKPMNGGTSSRNPGCPRCGYVGWLTLVAPPPQEPQPGPWRVASVA